MGRGDSSSYTSQMCAKKLWNLGQKLYDVQNLNEDQFTIPFSQNKSGIYLVKINNSLTKKIVVK